MECSGKERNESNDGTSRHCNVITQKTVFEDEKRGQPTLNESETAQKVKLPEKKRKRESRHQDSCTGECAEEIKKLRQEIEQNEQINSNFFTDVLNLLKGLQGNWERLKATAPQNLNKIFENFRLSSTPGCIKHDENGIRQIHLGRDIWLNEKEYHQVVWSSSSNSIFVKNLGMKLFGEDILKSHSVNGMIAPKAGEQKPPLDMTKFLALRDAYQFHLETDARWTNKTEVLKELDNVGHYLQEKSVELNRRPRYTSNKTTRASKSMKKRGNSSNARTNRKKF